MLRHFEASDPNPQAANENRDRKAHYSGPWLSSKLGTEPEDWYKTEPSKAVSSFPFLIPLKGK